MAATDMKHQRKLRVSTLWAFALLMAAAARAQPVATHDFRLARDAETIATRIVQAIGKPIALDSGVATVTASVGIALGESGETAASLVARADEAMYRMKQGGKAGFLFAGAAGG